MLVKEKWNEIKQNLECLNTRFKNVPDVRKNRQVDFTAKVIHFWEFKIFMSLHVIFWEKISNDVDEDD